MMFPRVLLLILCLPLVRCVTLQIPGPAAPTSETTTSTSNSVLTWYVKNGFQAKDAAGNPAPSAELVDDDDRVVGQHYGLYISDRWEGLCWRIDRVGTFCGKVKTLLEAGSSANAPALYVEIIDSPVDTCQYMVRDWVVGGVITPQNPIPDYSARYRCFLTRPTLRDVEAAPTPVRLVD